MNRDPALPGKVTPPSATGIVPRPRLFEAIDAARAGAGIWVSGPPGSGKTTLATSYLDQAGIAALWYQLDDGDGDPASVFYYLGIAARALGAGHVLPLMTAEYHASPALFARQAFRALFASVAGPFAVIFDGYQDVPVSSPFDELLRECLREMPPHGFAIVLSRADPPAAHARLRAHGRLAVLGWEALRLTPDEVEAIVTARGYPVSDVRRDSLHERTQGWAAGLVLMLEQARRSGTLADSPDLTTRQLVFDYLAGEIFDASDASTRDFLLRTAFLGQMTGPIAAELTGDARADALLSELHRRNYFVSLRPTDAGPVYQYHPMLRDYLRARVALDLPKDERRRLQRVAARLMERAGHVGDALAHYQESREWDEAARLVAQHAASLLAQGRAETLHRWIEEFPDEAHRSYPWLTYWSGASQVHASPRGARLLFERAYERFAGGTPVDLGGAALAACGAMEAILYELDDFALLDRWIAVIDRAIESGVELPSPSVQARVACNMIVSLTLRQPQRDDIGQWIERALTHGAAQPDADLSALVELLAALTMMWTGRYERARGLIDAAAQRAAAPGASAFTQLTLKNLQAMLHMLLAEREACEAAVGEGLATARTTGVGVWTVQLLLYGYGGALGVQDLERAAALRGELQAHLASAGRLNLCLYHHFAGWEAMLKGDLMGALQSERTALRMAIEVGCPFFEAVCRLALAQVLAACNDERKCVVHLRALREIVREIDNRHLEHMALVGFAQIALGHDRRAPGLRALRNGLQIGREFGYRHHLWWQPAQMADLLAEALREDIEPEYARSLIALRGLVPSTPPLDVEGWPWRLRVFALGPFRLLHNDAPLGERGKAQRRPLELLKVILAHGADQVAVARIVDALWPRIDGDSAHRSFTSALHRLRKLVGEDRAIVLHEGKVSLDRRIVWADTWALEDLAARLEEELQRVEPDEARVQGLRDRLVETYRGPFLDSDPEATWAVAQRDRLRGRFARAMTLLGRRCEATEDWDGALACYDKGVEADPQAEVLYRNIMVCLARLGRRSELLEAFRRCRNALNAKDLEPSAETRALYDSALAGR